MRRLVPERPFDTVAMSTQSSATVGSPSRSALVWLWLSVAVIAIDQITKMVALTQLAPHEPVPVLPFLNWTLVFNTGAAFSFLSDASGWQRWLFSVLALAVSAMLVIWLRRTPRQHIRVALPYALILAGALGNVIDRIRFGHVVDFIDVHWQGWHFPAFNIADSAISIGAVLLITSLLFAKTE
jgi:signal peptidase II